ncbi:MAG: glutamate-1-semialdehyde 2,1-aminomutase [Chlamydiia bacterium]|nr:glutamate-1-semialdehyde 2,1-aminomutase [Chlamydiia bacterium]
MKAKPKCQEIYKKLCDVTPGGANSPMRAWRAVSDFPLIAESARGALLRDADGEEYIDFCCSWGALLLGHSEPDVVAAAQAAVAQGSSFGMSTAIEEKLARTIVDRIPSVEQVRFVSSGTEATMTAARLARGYTGKRYIVKFTGHYHGHADFFLVQAGSGVAGLSATSSSAGIPEGVVQHTVCLPFNDYAALERFFDEDPKAQDLAAVILEPVAANMGLVPATPEFMRLLRERTQDLGALLIFDEVVTGFRLSATGAQGIYSEQPDLTCYGKIIGGGFPAAAFGGSREIMETLAPNGSVYQAGTLSGNPVAMAAGYSVLSRLTDSLYEELERKASIITKPVQAEIEDLGLNACVQQIGSAFTLFLGQRSVHNFDDAKACDLQLFREFFGQMREQGVLLVPSQFETNFVSAAHTEAQLEETRDAILSFLRARAPVLQG